MGSITIRDVPEETRAELAARAARSGRSMQEFLRLQLVEIAETPDVEQLLTRIRRRKARTHSAMSRADILAAKQADHDDRP